MKRRPQLADLAALALVLLLSIGGWLWVRNRADVTALPASSSRLALALAPPMPRSPIRRAGAEGARDKPQQEMVGIGAMLKKDSETGELLIVGAVPASPAATAGLDGRFVVRKIDDVVTEGLPLQQCVDLLRGAADTTVQLEVFDPVADQTRVVQLTRKKFTL